MIVMILNPATPLFVLAFREKLIRYEIKIYIIYRVNLFLCSIEKCMKTILFIIEMT